jgi:tetratricopeptide (TPR) repeat protein
VKVGLTKFAVGVAVAALLVEAVSGIGWWTWRSIDARLSISPTAAGKELASSWLVALPSSAMWLRRLRVDELLSAPPEQAAPSFARVARAQQRWMPVYAAGWLNQGTAALLDGDVKDAFTAVQAAVRRNPTSPYLHRLVALLYMKDGRYDDALDELAQAEALAPGFRVPKVEILPGDDEWLRLEGLRRSAEVYPRKRASALLAYASELRRLGRGDEVSRVLQPVANAPMVRITRAEWCLDDNDAKEAADLLADVCGNPRMPSRIRARAFSVLARALDALGRSDEAERAAQTAAHLMPSSPWPYVALSRMARRRGDYQTALRYIRSAWGAAPADISVLLEVGDVAEKAGDLEDARLALQRATELAPDRPDLAARLVEFLLRHGRFMDAALHLSTFLDRFPSDPKLLRLAGQLEEQTTTKR